jgi:acyl-CoA synthetase (AMP-forming)/AMP-acid ligase II
MGDLAIWWARQVALHGDNPFLVDVAGTVGYTYGDAAGAAAVAAGLLEELLGARRHVVTILPNTFGAVLWQVAIWVANGVHIPLSAESTEGQLGHLLPHSDAEVIVCEEEALGRVLNTRTAATAVVVINREGGRVRLIGAPSGARVLVPASNPVVADPEGRGDTIGIFYTSGSTGAPKGVVVTSSGYLAAAFGHPRRLDRTTSDNVMTTVPLFHAAGAMSAVGGAIAIGARITVAPRFSATQFWSWAGAAGATYALLIPTMLEILRRLPVTEAERKNPLKVAWSHLRDEELCERFGIEICAMWGLTETNGMGALMPTGHPWTNGLVGWPFPEDARVKALRPDGSVCCPSEEGELWFGHPGVMLGYYKDPVRTAETMRGRWVRTGDIGFTDELGRVYYRGRIKNVIHRGGESVFAEELEIMMRRHPLIEDCVAYGVPDPIRGEEVAVSLSAPHGEITMADLESWLRPQLERRLLPRYIFVDREPHPRLSNGKVDRMEIINRGKIESAYVLDR